jgi:hypothetical protein
MESAAVLDQALDDNGEQGTGTRERKERCRAGMVGLDLPWFSDRRFSTPSFPAPKKNRPHKAAGFSGTETRKA